MALGNNLLTHAEVIIKGTITAGGSTNKNTFNIFHFRRTTVANVPSEIVLDTAFQAAVASVLILALNNRWTQNFNTVRFYDDPTRVPIQVAHVNVGNVAGDSQPAHNYAYLLQRTGLRGRRYRGNKKFGPLSESNTTAGTDDILNAAALTLFGNLAAAMVANVVDANGNTWVPQVLSRKLSALMLMPQASVAAQDISAVLVNKRIGRMKVREVASVY